MRSSLPPVARNERQVRGAIMAHRKGGNFVDALIGAINRVYGCRSTVTFARGVPDGADFLVLR